MGSPQPARRGETDRGDCRKPRGLAPRGLKQELGRLAEPSGGLLAALLSFAMLPSLAGCATLPVPRHWSNAVICDTRAAVRFGASTVL